MARPAEQEATRRAVALAAAAGTAVVTLEPSTHVGRTGRRVRALLGARHRRPVAAAGPAVLGSRS